MKEILAVFLIVLLLFTIVQVYTDKKNSEILGQSVLLVKREVKSSEVILYFFRFLICIVISVYFIWRSGREMHVNILIFAILMAALASKAFFPLVPLVFFRKPCGVYENGVVTLRGTKLFREIKYYSCGKRNGEWMVAFVPTNFYLNRASYFYVQNKEFSRVKTALNSKCELK